MALAYTVSILWEPLLLSERIFKSLHLHLCGWSNVATPWLPVCNRSGKSSSSLHLPHIIHIIEGNTVCDVLTVVCLCTL